MNTMVTPLQLKNYLINNGPTPLIKIAKDFAEDPKQIMCIAEHYITKGKICCEEKANNCGSCQGCFASNLIKLSWTGGIRC